MFTLSTAEKAQAQPLSESELRIIIITRPKQVSIFLTLNLQNSETSKYFFPTQNLNKTVPKSKLWPSQEKKILQNYLLQCPVTTLSAQPAKSNQNSEIFRLKQPVQKRKPSPKFCPSKKHVSTFLKSFLHFFYYVSCRDSNFKL